MEYLALNGDVLETGSNNYCDYDHQWHELPPGSFVYIQHDNTFAYMKGDDGQVVRMLDGKVREGYIPSGCLLVPEDYIHAV